MRAADLSRPLYIIIINIIIIIIIINIIIIIIIFFIVLDFWGVSALHYPNFNLCVSLLLALQGCVSPLCMYGTFCIMSIPLFYFQQDLYL